MGFQLTTCALMLGHDMPIECRAMRLHKINAGIWILPEWDIENRPSDSVEADMLMRLAREAPHHGNTTRSTGEFVANDTICVVLIPASSDTRPNLIEATKTGIFSESSLYDSIWEAFLTALTSCKSRSMTLTGSIAALARAEAASLSSHSNLPEWFSHG